MLQTKHTIYIYACSTWLQEYMSQKYEQFIYYSNVNVDLIKESVIQ